MQSWWLLQLYASDENWQVNKLLQVMFMMTISLLVSQCSVMLNFLITESCFMAESFEESFLVGIGSMEGVEAGVVAGV